MKKLIQKCRIGSPGLMPITSEQTKRFAEWLLKGVGKVAEVVNNAAASALSTPTGTATTAATTPVTNSGSNSKVAEEAKKLTKEFIEKNGVMLSPSSWVVGKGNPWQGALTIATWDPRWLLGAFAADALTLAKGKPALKATGNAAVDVAARAGNKTAKAKAVSRRLGENILQLKVETPLLFPGQIGWAPKLTFKGYHASNEATLTPNFWFEGWALFKGAPHGFYTAEGTAPKSGFLADRPYVHLITASLDKPIVQVGDIPVLTGTKNLTRNNIERLARSMGADGIIYLNIADNLMKHLTVLKTLNPDVLLGISRNRIGKPLGFGKLTESKLLDRNNLGTYLGEGSEQTVYDAGNGFVHKVYDQGTFFNTLEDLLDFNKRFLRRNDFPLLVPIEYVGHLYLPRIGLPHQLVFYPVYRLKKITPNSLSWEELEPQVQLKLRKLGYNDLKEPGVFENEQHSLLDILPENIGFDNGLLRFIDVGVLPYKFGQIQSTPTIQNRPAPAASPLVTRLMRLQNKKDAGIIPKTDLALIIRDGLSDALIEDLIVKAYKRLGIEEDVARSAARTTVMNNGKGVHTPVIGDDGNLIGGISYVDKQQALKALRESGITNPTESDLLTIMGHEWGHLVEVPGMDKEVYTLLGQVLDNEGITAANPNWTVWDWINKIEKYLSEGRLDNGISNILERLYNMDYKTAQKFVANANRFSVGTGAAYLLNNLVNNENNTRNSTLSKYSR